MRVGLSSSTEVSRLYVQITRRGIGGIDGSYSTGHWRRFISASLRRSLGSGDRFVVPDGVLQRNTWLMVILEPRQCPLRDVPGARAGRSGGRR